MQLSPENCAACVNRCQDEASQLWLGPATLNDEDGLRKASSRVEAVRNLLAHGNGCSVE